MALIAFRTSGPLGFFSGSMESYENFTLGVFRVGGELLQRMISK